MAREKTALDLSTCGMEACRAALDKSVIELTAALDSTPKTTTRRRIKDHGKDLDLSLLADGIIEL